MVSGEVGNYTLTFDDGSTYNTASGANNYDVLDKLANIAEETPSVIDIYSNESVR